jgi:hypothetical protein
MQRRECENIRQLEKWYERCHGTDEADPALQLEARHFPLQRRSLRTVSSYHQASLRIASGDPGKGIDQEVEPLSLDQPPGGQNNTLLRPDPFRSASRGQILGPE